ncbi:glycosyl hydrolase family 95 catalytic domain-containing protein [Actinoplanes sp. CA-142083]|uniref:glycosyl hydrolase family 95 catalytic domain-containing protein n=1 Tax=Actinoplanes sp. CA-142083 TaxID=3239903 RepID=UPI003D90B539
MRVLRAAAAGLLLAGLVVAHPSPASAAPTDAAFNSSSGALNVDYAGYLAKHDVVYNRPNTNPLHGLTVGNGRTGAMAWDQNGITMQVSGVDLAEQSTYAAGNLNLNLNTAATTYQQRLSLYDGTLTTKYDSNRTVTVMGAPNSEVMGVHVEGPAGGSITLDLSLWDMNTVQNIADVPDLNTWRTVSTYADSTGAGLSRGQTDANGFGYTFAATVEGAAYTSQTVNGTRVRLSITPTSSYTIWFTAASRVNAPGRNSVQEARNQLAAVKQTGYATTFANYKNWWHAFWQRSFVQYNAGGSDYLENVYYLATYMIAAGGQGNYPLHFINGVFRATQDNSKWSNGYWYWNQRDVYNSFYASNHADMMRTFNNLYGRNLNSLKAYTQTRYGTDSLWVPETMGWDGNARGTVGSDFVNDIYSTGTEAAYNMYLYYRYTNDASYLQNVAYPFMRESARFYQNRLSRNGSQYYMASSNAHETYWDVKNAITDLAAVRLLFPLTIQVSTQLGLDAGLRAGWQDVLNNLAPYQTSNGAYLPHDPPTAQTRNGENVALELVWPYDQTGIGYPDTQTAVQTWNVRPFPYGNVWANDHVHAARLGLGEQAYQGMRTMLQKYQNYPNGMTNNTNGVFEYLGIHLAAMNESLLQSYNDKIRVFPALPSDSGFVGKFTLLAKDGFLVSSEREAGETKYIGIRSQFGKQARVVNPWGTQQIRVRRTSDNAIVTTVSTAEVSFATTSGTTYVIERTAKPLSSYASVTLTGTPNQGVKTLSGTASTLGLGTATGGGGGTALLAQANSKYVSANGNLVASATAIGATERFDLIDLGGGNVALRSRANNLYVCAENAGANPLVANRTAAGPWETFARVNNSDGTISLRATVNNKYVVAENAGAAALIANRDAIGPWEKFTLVNG